MNRKIVIANCNTCPFKGTRGGAKSAIAYVCTLISPVKNIDKEGIIPDWCPLEKDDTEGGKEDGTDYDEDTQKYYEFTLK